MIPPFDNTGNLPPGIHDANWPDFVNRFATNGYRKALLSGLEAALRSLRVAGCPKVYVDGSFVTSKVRPGDFDVVWDVRWVDPNKLDPVFLVFDADRATQKAKFLGEFFPSHVVEHSSGLTFLEFFQKDKYTDQPKGIITLDLGGLP